MAQLHFIQTPKRPWNAGRIIGAKPPLKPKHVWGIRQHLLLWVFSVAPPALQKTELNGSGAPAN